MKANQSQASQAARHPCADNTDDLIKENKYSAFNTVKGSGALHQPGKVLAPRTLFSNSNNALAGKCQENSQMAEGNEQVGLAQKITGTAGETNCQVLKTMKKTGSQLVSRRQREVQATALMQRRVSLETRKPFGEVQNAPEMRENNQVTLQDLRGGFVEERPAKTMARDETRPTIGALFSESQIRQHLEAPKQQQQATGQKICVRSTAMINELPVVHDTRQNSVQLSMQAPEPLENSILSLEEPSNLCADLVSISQPSLSVAAKLNFDGKSVKEGDIDGAESTTYNRKEKSLGELCRRFLFLYGTPSRGILYLDQCTKELGVERRRIYDIINILESFSVIQRCAKNEYKWRGIDKIVNSIERQIDACQKDSISGQQNADSKDKNQGRSGANLFEKAEGEVPEIWSSDEGEAQKGKRSRQPRKTPKYKKVKSLGNFCQQFIKLFVTWKTVLSLEEAAKQISDGEVYDEKLLKTKIRRLYDIANVLQSIGLIHKTQMSNSRKPAFKWIGLNGVVLAIQEIKTLVRTAQKELNSHKGSVKSSMTGKKSMQGVEWLQRQNSVRCSLKQGRGGQTVETQEYGMQSPPVPTNLKLKRSASFVEESPAKGSLILEEQKRRWANQQKVTLGGGGFGAVASIKKQELADADMQQSEGNILEVSGRKRKQNTDLNFQGLDRQDISTINSKLKKLTCGEEVEDVADGPADEGKLAGKKRARQAASADSFASDDDCELGDEDFFYGGPNGGLHNNFVKLNPEEEQEMIRDLENQAIENDPLKELDEALKDRATAQKTLRCQNQIMPSHVKINSSNFIKTNQEPAAAIKKLKQLKQMVQQSSVPPTPTGKTFATGQKSSSVLKTQEETKDLLHINETATGPFTASCSQQKQTGTRAQSLATLMESKAPVTDFNDFPMVKEGCTRLDEGIQDGQEGQIAVTVSELIQSSSEAAVVDHHHNKFNTAMKRKQAPVKRQSPALSTSDQKEASQFQSPAESSAAPPAKGTTSRRISKRQDKKEAMITKACKKQQPSVGGDLAGSPPRSNGAASKRAVALSVSTSNQRPQINDENCMMASNSADSSILDSSNEGLPILGHRQLSQQSMPLLHKDRNYLLGLQSFRFCLSSLPLIKQLSANLVEQKTTMSSHTGNEASSNSQKSIIGH